MGGTPFTREPTRLDIRCGTGFLGCERDGILWFYRLLDGQFGLAQPARSNGNGFADFLLGTAKQLTNQCYRRVCVVAVYALLGILCQDTWQASPRLTIIYGLRYEYQKPWRYRTQQITSFDFKNNKLVLPQTALRLLFLQER